METYFFILGFIVKWVLLIFVAFMIPAATAFVLIAIIYLILEDRLSDKVYTIFATIIFAFMLPLGVYVSANIKAKIEEPSSERVEISDLDTIQRFTLVDYRPPKHVYVTLKSVDSGNVYENEYVSKHCSISKDSIGKEYNIRVEYFHYSDDANKHFIRFHNLSGVFCG